MTLNVEVFVVVVILQLAIHVPGRKVAILRLPFYRGFTRREDALLAFANNFGSSPSVALDARRGEEVVLGLCNVLNKTPNLRLPFAR